MLLLLGWLVCGVLLRWLADFVSFWVWFVLGVLSRFLRGFTFGAFCVSSWFAVFLTADSHGGYVVAL